MPDKQRQKRIIELMFLNCSYKKVNNVALRVFNMTLLEKKD